MSNNEGSHRFKRLIGCSLIFFFLFLGSAEAGENTFIDNFGLYFGLFHNRFVLTDGDFKEFGDTVEFNSVYDTSTVEWYFDGDKVKSESGIRHSKLLLNKDLIPKSMNPKDIIQYKAGKDPVSHRLRHVVFVTFDGESRTWVLLE